LGKWGKRIGLTAAAALLLGSSTAVALVVRHEVLERELIAGLRHGGYVIYLRHAERLKGGREDLTGDSNPADFEDCTRQRNLTPYGEGEAALLGETLRKWGVSIDQVIANPLCRTRLTAMLAFGRATLDQRLYDPQFVRRLLSVPPRLGTNTVLVGSEFQLRDIIGVQVEPAEMAVFQPTNAGGFTLVGRIAPEEWLEE